MKSLSIIFVVAFIALGVVFAPKSAYEKTELKWYSMKEAQELAEKNNKKVFVFGQADWCHYCRKMEKEVFSKQDVVNTLNKYYYPVELTVDSDENIFFQGETYTMSHISGMLGIDSTPTLFFIDKNGEILFKQPGFLPADIFKNVLTYVGADTYKQMSFPQYYDGKQ